VVSTTLRPLYPRERPSTHCTGGWVGPRTCRDVCEKSCSHRDFFLLISYYYSLCTELHIVNNIVSLISTSGCLLTVIQLVCVMIVSRDTNGDYHLLQDQLCVYPLLHYIITFCRCPLYRFDPRTVQPVVSRYTD
jgi:hypothetical protein